MRALWAILLLLTSCDPATRAEEYRVPAVVDLNDASSLREINRVLEEEIKLASAAQPYLLLDLIAQAVMIKSRGVDLHRVPLVGWTIYHPDSLGKLFHLQVRPPVVRRKAAPAAADIQEPISFADMPTYYTIRFEPSLILTVLPTAEAGVWRWIMARAQDWWARASARATARSGNPSDMQPAVTLTLAPDQAQSLAWSLTAGMPMIIRRPLP